MNNPIKPPTQGVGVTGFKADVYANDLKKIDWHILIHLPKFQMFCIEQSKHSVDNVMDWILGYVQDECYKGDYLFFDRYVQWHDVKGYWRNESVYGELND